MISKIVSGGQTGVDRAALDAALELGIAHGGWVPRGRKAEDGTIPASYQVQEMNTDAYWARTRQNVLDSDGTLLISRGPLDGGSELTRDMANRNHRPWLHVDLQRENPFVAARRIQEWIEMRRIHILNVAGPRASKDPGIYEKAKTLLKAAFFLETVAAGPLKAARSGEALPRTLDEAADQLAGRLGFKDRMALARLKHADLGSLADTLGKDVRAWFGLHGDRNRELIRSYRSTCGVSAAEPRDVSLAIIRTLWRRLQGTHALRRIK